VRRIDWVANQLLAISLDAGCAIVVGTTRETRGVGLVARAPRAATSNPLVHALRKHLADATLRDARQAGAALLLTFSGALGDTTLACVFEGHAGAFVLCDEAGQVLAASGAAALESRFPFTLPSARRPLALAESLSALEAAGTALLAAGEAVEGEARRRALLRTVSRAADKAARRLAAIDADLLGTAEADTLRRHASLLLAAAYRTPLDASDVQVHDDEETPPRAHTFVLPTQPGGRTGPRAVVAVAESMFARARKRETAARVGAERHGDTARIHAALVTLAGRIAEASDDHAWGPLAEAAHALGVPEARASVMTPSPARGAPRRPAAAPRVPYRRFLSADGRPLLVGRGARDNDALTLHYARPHDRWLHARGVPGAHVVIPLARGEICPDARLLDAATLAAHFSDARGESVVDVQHAERRHVRKPRGSAPGAVVVDRERVLVLRLEPARLARLLRGETLAEGDADGDRPRPPHK
jgi:hypothetical protein